MSVWQYMAFVEGKIMANGGHKTEAPSHDEFIAWRKREIEVELNNAQ